MFTIDTYVEKGKKLDVSLFVNGHLVMGADTMWRALIVLNQASTQSMITITHYGFVDRPPMVDLVCNEINAIQGYCDNWLNRVFLYGK